MFSSVFNNNSSRGDPSQTSDLEYVINHVFFPVNKPEDEKRYRDPDKRTRLFAHTVCAAVDAYYDYVDDVHKSQWDRIVQMLRGLRWHSNRSEFLSQLREMQPGGMLLVSFSTSCSESIDSCLFPFTHYETAIIFRKHDQCTLYEAFELNPFVDKGALEKVIRPYPELTLEIPNEVFHDGEFQCELADFLSSINSRNSDQHAEWYKDRAKYGPRYTTQLLSGILGAIGRPAEVTRVAKRVVRRVRGLDNTWYRSEEWFLMKVVIQSSLDRSLRGRTAYKMFMLFLMLNLAKYGANASLSSDLLHLMSVKILRRFRKLGTSVPKWLAEAATQICTHLSDILDNRCIEAQILQRSSHSWNLSQLDLTRDIQLPLPRCSEYLSTSLIIHIPNSPDTPVLHHHIHGSLHDFLCSQGMFFEEAYRQNDRVALYDVEKAVEQEIDDWSACVMDVDEACIQLEVLLEKYLSGAWRIFGISDDQFRKPPYDPEHFSIALLTIIELWIAIDKLVVKKIPILASFSPEIPMDLFDRLLLRKTMNLHRFFRAHQYLSVRHAQPQPASSVVSQRFTEHSFPVRYYDSSSHLQDLKYCIQGDALRSGSGSFQFKVILFELQCPVSFEAWRSATIRLMDSCYDWRLFSNKTNHRYLFDVTPIVKVPELQRYALRHQRSLISLAYSSEDELLYVIYDGDTPRELPQDPRFRDMGDFAYKIPSGLYADSSLQEYLTSTTHTSNQVLSAQASCHTELPLHEFTAFGHLRSGGSLQWMNILREVRNRSLNFLHHETRLLLAQASSQVGPLAKTGELMWHLELQDASFCHTLLDELERLFIDVGAGSSDGPAMGTISILASLVVSGPSEAISERTFKLLRNVREKTFNWVNDLLYDVIKSPTNEERRQVLWDMAAICRSTFDVEPSRMHKLLHSARDVEIALSCAILMRTIVPTNFPGKSDLFSVPNYVTDRSSSDPDTHSYSRILQERDRRLSHTLEEVLKNAIQADTPDLGVDLAVQKRWPGYRPGIRRWEPLDCPNSPWISCHTGATGDQQSQKVHVNLLDGSLVVDGQPIGDRLPSAITDHPVYRIIFGDVRAFQL